MQLNKTLELRTRSSRTPKPPPTCRSRPEHFAYGEKLAAFRLSESPSGCSAIGKPISIGGWKIAGWQSAEHNKIAGNTRQDAPANFDQPMGNLPRKPNRSMLISAPVLNPHRDADRYPRSTRARAALEHLQLLLLSIVAELRANRRRRP